MIVKSIELYKAGIRIDESPGNRQAIYRYMLLECEKEIEYLGKLMKVPCYGISIVREDLENGEVYLTESDCIENMTTFKYKAAQLLKKLYINLVSPIHLIDVAGCFADEWVADFEQRQNIIETMVE